MASFPASQRVLLVADDARLRHDLHRALVGAGMSVTGCDRFAALELIGALPVDVIVLDPDRWSRDGTDKRGDRLDGGYSSDSLLRAACASDCGRIVVLTESRSRGEIEQLGKAGREIVIVHPDAAIRAVVQAAADILVRPAP